MMKQQAWTRAAVVTAALLAALATGPVEADAEATASKLRFATSPDGPWVEDSAVFEGGGIDQIVIAYDYDEASGEQYEVTVVAPGGLPVHSNRQARTGSGTATATVKGSGIYRDLASDLYETLRSSRTDADRLATARFGLTEYILQLQANATRARSALDLLALIDLPAEQKAMRADVERMVERFAALTAQARATDPSDVEKIHTLAAQIAERIGQDLPRANALSSHAASVERMAIPATSRSNDQPYDVLVSVDDFAAVSGEVRVYPPVTLYLPRLSQNEQTR